jgi:hypothetical protein
MQFNNFYFATGLIGLQPARSHKCNPEPVSSQTRGLLQSDVVYRKTNWWFDVAGDRAMCNSVPGRQQRG